MSGLRGLISLGVVLIVFAVPQAAAAAAPFTFQTQFGTSSLGTLNGPFGLAVSRDGASVYVSDHGTNRILQYSRDGTFIRAWGGTGSGPGQFKLPDGIATDAAGNVYVADCTNNRVSKFTASGTFVRAFGRNGGDGTAGSGNGEFSCTVTVAIDPPATSWQATATTTASRCSPKPARSCAKSEATATPTASSTIRKGSP